MTREVTLVTGPPCAGKTTYVRKHARHGDLVVDLDQLARQAGSPLGHNHEGHFYGRAQKQFQELCDRITYTSDIRAWVIRCVPRRADRLRVALELDATRCLVLLPDRTAVHLRAAERVETSWATSKAIEAWFDRYQPSPTDEVIHN